MEGITKHVWCIIASYLKCPCCRMFSSVMRQFISGTFHLLSVASMCTHTYTHWPTHTRAHTHSSALTDSRFIVHKATHSRCTLTEWPVCIYEVLPPSCVRHWQRACHLFFLFLMSYFRGGNRWEYFVFWQIFFVGGGGLLWKHIAFLLDKKKKNNHVLS